MAFWIILKDLWATKTTLIVITVPLLLLPLPLIVDGQEAKCAYGLAIMAVFWISESLPLAATALLPVLVFPLLGVMKSSDVASNYIKESSMFGLGGLMIAIAVERWNLHKRIALKALMLVGSEPKWLMLGFMLPTWFLSMWVSNTATTAMMIPIVGAVMNQLDAVKENTTPSSSTLDGRVNTSFELEEEKSNTDQRDTKYQSCQQNGEVKQDDVTVTINGEIKHFEEVDGNNKSTMTKTKEDGSNEKSEDYVRMCKGMALCIAYAANVGGTGSLSGTGPNIIMQGQADLIFQKYGEESGVNFASWMVFALPGSFVCLFLTWMWLQLVFLGWRSFLCKRKGNAESDKRVKQTIRKAYKELGSMSFAEITVLIHFVLLVFLWFSRKPPNVNGWDVWYKPGYVGDSASAILICLSMFTFPSERPAVLCFRRNNVYPDAQPRKSVPPLLDWPTVEKKFPWGVLLLIGGGFALADACEKSGLSAWIGRGLEVFSDLDPWVMNLVLTGVVALSTEVTSNTATSTLLLPILGQLAENLHLNPLYLMFPCAIATSFAFMLPVATPPNAIVFATGYLTVKDMALAGSMMNVICIAVLAVATNTWGNAYFKFHTLPPGFNRTITSPIPSTSATISGIFSTTANVS